MAQWRAFVGRPRPWEAVTAARRGPRRDQVDIGGEDAGLAIGDFAQRTTPLRCHTDRVVPLLGEVRAIDNDHAIDFPWTEVKRLSGLDARLVAGCLVQAELWGHPSHGMLRLGWYVARIRSGVRGLAK